MEPELDRDVTRLLDGGAWACSWGDAGGLRQVCNQLAEVAECDLAERARRVVSLFHEHADDSAFYEWALLAAQARVSR